MNIEMTPERQEAIQKSIGILGLPTRDENKLLENGITTVEDLLMKSRQELSQIRGFGPTALDNVLSSVKNLLHLNERQDAAPQKDVA